MIAVGAEDQTNSIVVVPGANAKLTKEDVAASEEIFRDAAVVLCQMEVPAEANLEALNAARAAGCVSVLNTAPVPPGGIDDALLKAAAIVCPNEVELALLVGADADSTATIPGALVRSCACFLGGRRMGPFEESRNHRTRRGSCGRAAPTRSSRL